MLLEQSTWQEIEQYLTRSQGIIIPIGSTEQHGPIGLIGTDAICAREIAAEVGLKTDALVAPVINVGMAQHHMAFPGTISLRPSTLMNLLLDYLGSLSRHGFERFFFINGHGGNEATIEAAFAEFYLQADENRQTDADGVRCQLKNWWRHESVTAMANKHFGPDEGAHATPSEVAITQYKYPESRREAKLEKLTGQPCIINGSADFRRRYPDGRIGADSSLATPENGKLIFETAVSALVKDYKSFLDAD